MIELSSQFKPGGGKFSTGGVLCKHHSRPAQGCPGLPHPLLCWTFSRTKFTEQRHQNHQLMCLRKEASVRLPRHCGASIVFPTAIRCAFLLYDDKYLCFTMAISQHRFSQVSLASHFIEIHLSIADANQFSSNSTMQATDMKAPGKPTLPRILTAAFVIPHNAEESVTRMESQAQSPRLHASQTSGNNGEQCMQTTDANCEESEHYPYGRPLSTVSEKSEGATDALTHVQMLKNLVSSTILERDLAREKLSYTVSAYNEQQHLIEGLDRMNTISHSLVLQAMKAKLKAESHIPSLRNWSSTHWIGGTWLAGTSKALASAEASWERGKAQEALFKVVELIHTRDIGPELLVNARLLRAAIVRSSGQVKKSLGFIEKALQLARNFRLTDLAGKAQFHRAICFLYLDRFAESSWCFLLSVHTPGYASQIEVNRLIAEERRLDLPLADHRRYLPPGFSDISLNLPEGEEFLDISSFDHTAVHNTNNATDAGN